MPITKNARATGAGKYALELDNNSSGWVNDVEGGHATADVVTEKIGGDWLQRKHISNIKYEDVSFTCGTGMSNKLYQWINTGFNQTFNQSGTGRTNGSIVTLDYDFNEISRLTFYEAILSELGMPALDAGSKDAAKMKLKFTIEKSRYTTGGGKSYGSAPKGDKSKQKKWTPANFKLQIDGMDEVCSKVNKIDALTIKQKVTDHSVGQEREYQKEATSVETPNLVITMAESHALSLFQWHEDFVIKGNCAESNEKSGHLLYLTPDLNEGNWLFRLDFFNIGIFKVTPDKVEAGGEGIRRVKAEMYVEEIKFSYNGSATWS